MGTELRKLRRQTGRTVEQMADFFCIPYLEWARWEINEGITPDSIIVSITLYIRSRKNYAKIEELKEKLQRSEALQKETSAFWQREMNKKEASETRQAEKELLEARKEINRLQSQLCGATS